MARIIELKAGAVPPKGDDWAMVVVHRPGIEAQGSVVRHNGGATFYTPAAGVEVERAIAIRQRMDRGLVERKADAMGSPDHPDPD